MRPSLVLRRLFSIVKTYLLDYPRTAWSHSKSIFGNRNVTVYWYNRRVNFGDLITPYLFSKYGFKPNWAMPEYAKYISTGSILQIVRKPYRGIVVGSGFIQATASGEYFESCIVLGTRGLHTCKKLGRDVSTVTMGDPGLLCKKFVDVPRNKKWKIGLVPHFVDARSPVIEQLKDRHGKSLRVIDVRRQPEEVWQDLANCEVILSSSLHGLVCSDAMEIPTCWITLSDNVLGEGFKFRDYYSAFDETPQTHKLDGNESIEILVSLAEPRDPVRLKKIIDRLDKMFESLGNFEQSKPR